MSKSRKLTIGILAHVDAGKTTLSEAMLYRAGAIRQLGRVDHASAFLDSDEQEKERGITIFAGQAGFSLPLHDVTLLDTPGHVDFSAETERTLGVLDYAILVISGRDGVQGHTATLWRLLEKYRVPVFIFVNKMDADGADAKAIMGDLKDNLDDNCVDFTDVSAVMDEIAMCDETVMDEYLESGEISDESVSRAVASRRLFPCFFGSALKLEGVDEFMEGLDRLAVTSFDDSGELKIRPFRITRDKQGERLTHLKVLSGCLNVRDVINEEKVNQIRIYSGSSFSVAERAEAGTICAVTGLSATAAPEGMTEAVISYSLILPEGVNVHDAYIRLKQLEEEDPQLHITWSEQLQEIQVRLMGEVQLEVLERLISQRFGIQASFGEGRIAYRETIAAPVAGAGHYEPLRHYSEVHLLLEPLERGRGMEFASAVSSDVLDTNWQRLIMQHLMEKEHAGTLTGSPVTDIRITITGGRAHDKHTEGGDFRQSTYRAIRQALRKSLDRDEMILLEPWYEFVLQVPQEMVGRAMADIQRMGGSCRALESGASDSALTKLGGSAPVSEMKSYVTEVASYTKGYGRLSLQLAGYEPCHNQDAAVAEIAYDADRDVDNPADSIFCSHGAGHNVPWNEADEMMHVLPVRTENDTSETSGVTGGGGPAFASADDRDLDRIFERTFRKSEKKKPRIEAKEIDSEAERRRRAKEAEKREAERNLQEYLLVDGYNIIFAWDELKELAKVNIDAARESLIEILGNYRGFRSCEVIAVFDAYKVKGGQRRTEKQSGITVVYTAEAETADTYIERTTYELAGKAGSTAPGKYRVRVATSDRLEQMIVTGNNAHRVSADEFKKEVEQVNEEIGEYISRLARRNRVENPNKLEIPQNEHKDVVE
ncbi:MAG: TetM/TetW/TetO/TetS family tetracycline resistance ribosomal protection protein [Clostridia bacterium]|nr:TetM/TetW/TetO/TetS family tetracycline resistance ribosomal protection protein [Clostridia bacterium]